MDSHFKKLYKNIGSYVNKKYPLCYKGVYIILYFDDDTEVFKCYNVLEKRKDWLIFTSKTQRKIARFILQQYTYEDLSNISHIEIVI